MINFLEETKQAIEKHGHRPDDIVFIGIPATGESLTWAEFEGLADKEYYEEVGELKVQKDLIIVFSDGSRLYRHDYDTIEEWRYMLAFKMPIKTRPLKSLWMCSENELYGCWQGAWSDHHFYDCRKQKHVIEKNKNLQRTWTVDGKDGYYIRKSDLSDPEREAFEKFLRATCRNAPVPPEETPGNTAWWHDYQAFARGEDPYLGMRLFGDFADEKGKE